MGKKVLGIVGSYRKGGIVDSLVDEALAAAEKFGAQTTKTYLIDKHIEFCTNCRRCMQDEGPRRGRCIHQDDVPGILDAYEEADALVLGAPVNAFNVNAVTRKFMERLGCYAYWPWGARGPKWRIRQTSKNALLITSSAMPALLGRVFTGAPRALKFAARAMGAKPAALVFAGLCAVDQHQRPSEKARRKARRAAERIIR